MQTYQQNLFNFKHLADVNNPSSIHGMFPYRGKISSKEASQIISQFPQNSVVLDPFCGTGTIVYETTRHNLIGIGVENNPIAYDLSKAKLNIHENIQNVLLEVEQLISEAKHLNNFPDMAENAKGYFHIKTSKEIMRTAALINQMSDYLKGCFYGAIALSARGCNHYIWTSSSVGKNIEPKKYINFYEKFYQKVKKHHYPLLNNKSQLFYFDSRNLSRVIKKESIDIVFTSPPYFNCLDYTSYYSKIVYQIFGVDRKYIKTQLIQSLKTYKEDMEAVMNELFKVCKPGANVIFVVGDKKINGEIVKGEDFFDQISPFKKIRSIEREYVNTSSKVFDSINKTERKEQIIVWTK